MATLTENDPDHHDVFPGGKAGVEVKPSRQSMVTRPAPPPETFSDHATGLEPYHAFIDAQASLRAPKAVPASLLAQPLH